MYIYIYIYTCIHIYIQLYMYVCIYIYIGKLGYVTPTAADTYVNAYRKWFDNVPPPPMRHLP